MLDNLPERGAVGRITARVRQNHVVRNAAGALRVMLKERSVRIWFGILVGILIMGVVGPVVAPYGPTETVYSDDGSILINEEPSFAHPLGTTDTGYDIFSRLLYGAQPTIITGGLGGGLIVLIGGSVGITAGYVGGRVENALMRFTDMAYGVPLIPFALVIVAFFGVGFLTSILVIGLIIWRGMARVLRSQVLQIKERPFILAAKATGASTPRIIFKHILPNVGTMTILFFSLGVGYTILLQAGLAYLGVSDPSIPSWGIMVRNAQSAGMVTEAWWWSVPPGLLISLTVMSTFMFGRSYETVSGAGDNESAMAQAG